MLFKRSNKLTPRARRVLKLAQAEAKRLNHHYLGTEHLLLALLRENEGIAAKILNDRKVSYRDVSEAVEQIVCRPVDPADKRRWFGV